MGRRANFPVLKTLDLQTRMALIAKAHLCSIDEHIAVCKLVYDMDYADIAADVKMARTSVSYRMRRVIRPKLLQWIRYTGDEPPGACCAA